MAVKFVDSQTGEVVGSDQASAPVRAENGVNLAWVLIVMALVIGFFVGGGVATYISQDQISDLKVQLERTETIR